MRIMTKRCIVKNVDDIKNMDVDILTWIWTVTKNINQFYAKDVRG